MLKTKERKTDGRGKHPNSLANLKFIKPGEALNPHGRPPGTTYSLLAPLIRVIESQQFLIDIQADQMTQYLQKLLERRKAASTLVQDYEASKDRLRELEKELKQEQGQRAFWQKSCKAANELKDDLEKQLALMTERADKLLEELKPYREAKMAHIKDRIGLENAGHARR